METTAGSCGALLDEVDDGVVRVVGVVEHDVVLAQLVEDVGRFAGLRCSGLGAKGANFEIGALDVAVEKTSGARG